MAEEKNLSGLFVQKRAEPARDVLLFLLAGKPEQ
jgi:hypothetical protein